MTRCPKCKVPTTRIEYEGAGVRMCGQCGGTWVTPIALKAIANRRQVAFTEAVKERFVQMADESNATEQLICMRCGKTMIKEHFKEWDDIVIDRCAKCGGIWLDPGELEKIQIYWEYFQDHPEESNMDAIAKKAVLTEHLRQRKRDIEEAKQMLRAAAASRGYMPKSMLGSALRLMLGQ